MEDHIIPAASIHGVDLTGAWSRDPERCEEIVRLGDKFAYGEETDEDLLRLSRLLFEVDIKWKAEELLRCNMLDSKDPAFILYRQLFGTTVDENLDRALRQFEDQFGVVLSLTERQQFNRLYYTTSPASPCADDSILAAWFSGRCWFRFDIEGPNAFTADGGPDDEESQAHAVLIWSDGQWVLRELHDET